jgi:hypothetical protein
MKHFGGERRILMQERCAMDQPGVRRHGSFVGPIILIVLGGLLLTWKLRPDFSLWSAFFRYWPVILILIGLGKIWDSYYIRRHTEPGAPPATPAVTGTGIAWILLLIFFIFAAWHSRGWQDYGPGHNWGWGPSWHDRTWGDLAHDTQAIELQGAKSVDMDFDMPAGELQLSGGSSRLMDADFRHYAEQGKPTVDYSVSGDRGRLRVSQDENQWHTHFGNEDNEWNMRVANAVPLDLHVQLGAGHTNLRLNGVNVKSLDVHMGAGQLDLDLTGEHKTNVEGTIEGGVGQATVRLPKDVGVHVDASGGIGSVDTSGLRRDGGAYVNDAYGKSPTTIDLTIHGGVGEIRLIEE